MERQVPVYTFEQVKKEVEDKNNAAILALKPEDRANARLQPWLFYLEHLLKQKHAETGFILSSTRLKPEATKLLSYDEILSVAVVDYIRDIKVPEKTEQWDGDSSQIDWERYLKKLAGDSTFLYNGQPRVMSRFVRLQLQRAAELARAEAEHVKKANGKLKSALAHVNEANRRLQSAVAQVSFWETKIPTETGRLNENR